jgi:hypothetical protein
MFGPFGASDDDNYRLPTRPGPAWRVILHGFSTEQDIIHFSLATRLRTSDNPNRRCVVILPV